MASEDALGGFERRLMKATELMEKSRSIGASTSLERTGHELSSPPSESVKASLRVPLLTIGSSHRWCAAHDWMASRSTYHRDERRLSEQY